MTRVNFYSRTRLFSSQLNYFDWWWIFLLRYLLIVNTRRRSRRAVVILKCSFLLLFFTHIVVLFVYLFRQTALWIHGASGAPLLPRRNSVCLCLTLYNYPALHKNTAALHTTPHLSITTYNPATRYYYHIFFCFQIRCLISIRASLCALQPLSLLITAPCYALLHIHRGSCTVDQSRTTACNSSSAPYWGATYSTPVVVETRLSLRHKAKAVQWAHAVLCVCLCEWRVIL